MLINLKNLLRVVSIFRVRGFKTDARRKCASNLPITPGLKERLEPGDGPVYRDRRMLWRIPPTRRMLPSGFIEPCLPTKAILVPDEAAVGA